MLDTDTEYLTLAQGKSDDASCIAKFFLKPVLLGKKSIDAGRQIFEDREYVEIMVKGQDKQVFTREAKEEDKIRFPNAYMAFKLGKEVPVTGTPIGNLPGIEPSRVEMLKLLGIRTIEDMAGLGEEGLNRVGMGARDLQAKCKAYIAKTSDEVITLKAQLDEQTQLNAAMREQIDKMQEQITALSQPKTRKKK